MDAKHNTQKNRSDNYGRNHTGKPSGKDENGAEAVVGKTRGLCKDCEKRITCELPIGEEGVWRCRDYS